MTSLPLATLAVLLAALLAVQAVDFDTCMCPCERDSSFQCECECAYPKTVCEFGFTKVCPEKVTGCGAARKFCPKKAVAIAQLLEDGVGSSRKGRPNKPSKPSKPSKPNVKPSKPVNKPPTASKPGKATITVEDIKCKDTKGKNVPKFSCLFKLDYYPGVSADIKSIKCTHKKSFVRCPVTLETEDGCKVKVQLVNKLANVNTIGKVQLDCPEGMQTVKPAATKPVEITTLAPYGHAGENITVLGDGCSCIPDFFAALTSLPETRAIVEERAKNDMDRFRVTQEVRCKGIPKFECTFFGATDKYCDEVEDVRAAQCNHREEIKRCPVTVITKTGCKVEVLLTNKGEKMLVSDKIKVSGGPQATKGFMESCVCIGPSPEVPE